ncbi:unnamed protein product [Penicillium salamii]|uniref:CBM-cenC domain-containing protein n=1 Tax=Penicillium salamii TaxID=1612424 RepID=A0A9W4N6X3_9EURO|nr:unnamed protein product [Penicillium salamii]CAG8251515.1 unnamed protein product [Penicillium salamii]CAG8275212.1 unnamed protein product [Penicillium salamii]CAG8293767.1 unnamed protein product [Penicillium salamii]CAG8389080.1 unnamed protein product [Penicillium salamii]
MSQEYKPDHSLLRTLHSNPFINPTMSLSCNAVSNPSFETGILSPWHAPINVATITNGSTAYSGNYYLNLQTAVGNRGNTISQGLRHLKRHTQYKFSVQAQLPSPSGSEYCSVYVYIGRNATVGNIASAQLFHPGEWMEVAGSWVPRREQDVLSIVAACDSEDSSVTGNVLLDEIVFAPVDCYGLE